MKMVSSFKSKILGTGNDSKTIIIRIIVGLIFISEGILKYKQVQWLGPGRFTEIGFSNPFFWAYFTGAIEILCGTMVLSGLLTRLASIPLLTIMLTALFTTKLTIIKTHGIWTFLHEYTTDFALTLLLVLLLFHGGGKWSVERMFTR
jgi:putative oxidoreductase